MDMKDDVSANSNYGSPIGGMELMDTVSLTTTLAASSTTTSSPLAQKVSRNSEEEGKKRKWSNATNSSSSHRSPDTSLPPSSPDLTCSSTTPSLPSHSYVSYDGRRYTVFEVCFRAILLEYV